MKIALKSLKKYVDVTQIDSQKFVYEFSSAVAEIESLEDTSKLYEGIVVGEVIEIKDHPEVERFLVAKVNIGNKTVQVVAGAKNIKVGDKVAYIAPGYKTPVNPYPDRKHITIKAKKLAGVESQGMLMSEKELGISDNHAEILVLPNDLQVGTSIGEALELADTIVEVENKSFTHRPDCFGLIGIAREIGALFNLSVSYPDWYQNNEFLQVDEETKHLSVSIQFPKDKPYVNRYTAIVLKDVKIQDSPLWMKIFLKKHGISPINNVVDITNYVTLVTSQPLHAFDYDAITMPITVRLSNRGEKIHTLDDKVHELDDDTVVIADKNFTIAIGGVIGGKESGITDKTKTVVLESANFDLYAIRRASMKYGLFTEAVTRFGKGLDPEQTVMALNLAVDLLKKYANAKIATNTYDWYPVKREPYEISTTVEFIKNRVGAEKLTDSDIAEILQRLQLSPDIDGNKISVTVPTLRFDLQHDVDLVEEVARIYGYNRIKTLSPVERLQAPPVVKRKQVTDYARRVLINLGLNEILTYSFVSQDLLEKCHVSHENCYKIVNAISPELEYVRNAILPTILEKAINNLNNIPKLNYTALFEIGNVHIKDMLDNDNTPKDLRRVAIVIASREKADYYLIKHYVDKFLQKMYVEPIYKTLSEYQGSIYPVSMFHPGRSAVIYSKDKVIGVVGQIHPFVSHKFKAQKYNIIFAELDLDNIILVKANQPNYNEPSRFPDMIQDMCFVVDFDTKWSDFISTVNSASRYLVNLEAIDIYASKEQKKNNQKQFTIRLYFNRDSKQLSEKEIEKERKRIVSAVESKLKGKLKE